MLKEIIVIKKLETEDCCATLLSKFNRYQEIKRCWRKENGKWILKNIAFIEQWDDNRKSGIIKEFISCIRDGGVVLGVYLEENLIGFSWIEPQLFGCKSEYLNLDSLQVSYGFRKQGIGRILFEKSCDEAKQLGAKKLYISANSSEETQAFYKAMGCYETIEINQELFEKEPFDCHMEYCL